MIKRVINIFSLISFIVFFFLISKYYFSEKNIVFTNKMRNSYSLTTKEKNIKLPILKNDTRNIITYKNEIEEFEKKRKKRFWERLISGDNE